MHPLHRRGPGDAANDCDIKCISIYIVERNIYYRMQYIYISYLNCGMQYLCHPPIVVRNIYVTPSTGENLAAL